MIIVPPPWLFSQESKNEDPGTGRAHRRRRRIEKFRKESIRKDPMTVRDKLELMAILAMMVLLVFCCWIDCHVDTG